MTSPSRHNLFGRIRNWFFGSPTEESNTGGGVVAPRNAERELANARAAPEETELTVYEMWNVIQAYLVHKDIRGFVPLPRPGIPAGFFHVQNEELTLQVILRIERNTLCVRVPVIVNVPLHRRAEAAKLLTLINFGLVVGGFQMDMRDGETFFLFANTAEGFLQVSTVDDCVSRVIISAGKFIPSILRLIYDPNATALECYQSAFLGNIP